MTNISSNNYIFIGATTIIADASTYSKEERKYFYKIDYQNIFFPKDFPFRFSMEAHAVHYNKKYASFNDAAAKHDGLAVVAFFLQATDDFENACFKKLSDAVMDIVKINSITDVTPGNFQY